MFPLVADQEDETVAGCACSCRLLLPEFDNNQSPKEQERRRWEATALNLMVTDTVMGMVMAKASC